MPSWKDLSDGARPAVITAERRNPSETSTVDSVMTKMQEDLHELANLTRDHDATHFHHIQQDQHDEHLLWVNNLRAELLAEHDFRRSELHKRHELSLEELAEAHNKAMAEAEDNQVKAEAKTRSSHEQAKRDNATALKHMEAYCAGVYSTGEQHNRTVTDQDRAELAKTRLIRDHMDTRHESAINVLRGEQNRRIKTRAQRQEVEDQNLRNEQKKEELELERELVAEIKQLDELLNDKTRRLRGRWRLQTAIFVRKAKTSYGVAVEECSPSIGWPTSGPLEECTGAGAICT
ncbi:hypothetical protein LTR62_006920 [Meristemomyces frigidus]|uniref:Uncharacterized protein n=1 Tax=Meristemomyces frigidus TaxID=1508187 RepID=A0AAN7TBB9_9PEZI|nr:hypothetical protein LTR62_006920 [Meristemomyces frigidus]